MKNSNYYGIIPAVITPLNEDFSLDINSLEKLIEYLLGAGVHGLFVAGYTGEGAALPFDTLSLLAKNTEKIVNDRAKVCYGVLETGTEKTIETANKLIDMGIDFLSTTVACPPPCVSQDEIIEHYYAITNNTDAEWLVYGNSGSMPNIEPNTFHTLAQMDKIVAIKDTRSDYEGHLKNLIAVENDNVNMLCGGEYLVGPGLIAGADGNISGAANLFPAIFVELYNAVKREDINTVNQRARDIAELHGITNINGTCWLSAFKYACARLGIMNEYCLPPSQPVSREDRYNIDKVLEKYSDCL